LASDDVAVEIVIAANACREELPEIAEQDPRIEVAWIDEPVGFSEANNIGARKAAELGHQPDFFLFLNNDAMVERDALAKLVARAEQTPGCGIVGPRLMIWGSQGVLNSLGLNLTRTGEAWDEGIGIDLESYGSLPRTGPVVAVTGAALMIRTHLFEELAGWEELYEYYFEDIDFCLRAQSRGWAVVRVTDAIVWHAISATAARGSEFKLHLTWRNRLLLWFIHWPTGELIKTAPKLVYDEVSLMARRLVHKAYFDARLQARSWKDFLRHFPQAVRLRRQARGDGAWVGLLKRAGSVPVIHLPELPEEALSEVSLEEGLE
jgi:GT2 family glycosyltransferase